MASNEASMKTARNKIRKSRTDDFLGRAIDLAHLAKGKPGRYPSMCDSGVRIKKTHGAIKREIKPGPRIRHTITSLKKKLVRSTLRIAYCATKINGVKAALISASSQCSSQRCRRKSGLNPCMINPGTK